MSCAGEIAVLDVELEELGNDVRVALHALVEFRADPELAATRVAAELGPGADSGRRTTCC